MVKYVYDFSEGDKSMKDLLGGKGANLAEMTKLGLPVPPGFTITTEACRAYLKESTVPESLATEVTTALRGVEDQMGRRLGDPSDPLLVSVRSGAKFSMPGMMETVLNIGLNDESVLGLAAVSGNERFAWDSYRRLIQMFGKTVLDIDGDLFSDALDELKAARGVKGDTELTAEDLKGLVDTFKGIVKEQTGNDFPQDPRTQMDMGIEAVFRSWNTERARIYRRRERIPHDLGTAVNICTMVFGNMGENSGTGVCFTRDPSSGHSGVYGDYLENAQGEDVVAGIRNTLPLSALKDINKPVYDELRAIMRKLETHYRDMCDIEFTVERGKLWMLQTRVGKRTAAAAFRIATQLLGEKLITRDEALGRVTGDQLTQLMFPQFDAKAEKELIARGMAASPGAAVGKIAFNNAQAVEAAEKGIKTVLVRRETNPDDLPGMVAAEGVLTARGGKTSHAAVVARGMGKTCVCGAESLVIDEAAGTVTIGDLVLTSEDTIAIDGQTGEIFRGEVPVADSPVTTYLADGLEAGIAAAGEDQGTRELVEAVDKLLGHADKVRRLRVRANADTPLDSKRAIAFGAEGIGLCRTEHMFLGERRPLVERAILSAPESDERQAAFNELEKLQKQDFLEMLEVMDGKAMTVRLIDPPLHEFMPALIELETKVAVGKATGTLDPADEAMLVEVRRMHEQNPMLGLRGVRLGIYLPGLFALQMRALCEAAAELVARGLNPRPEIMVPLVGSVRELQLVREEGEGIIASVAAAHGVDLSGVSIGAMIELPRAAMTAEDLAEEADFFSFGTNDLTQTVWGFSRDDVEGVFFPQYIEAGIFGVSPFESIDVHGVGTLVSEGVRRARSTKPNIKLGVCGEHGGDPQSIHFFHNVGVDYVSCSPFRVPVARLEAGRAAVEDHVDMTA
ncbi:MULTISPECIES: pyruvate, phosphate dikinase [Actinomycetes]|uniref:pyruvate, phosphate dikinase n=1 Tax=Actinomycetes TaxID=1760 RepID=UPI0004465C66|nr:MULTISPECIES: pyruvate, phosphate dikinase [Actinomycetes]EWC99082.1 pyruvate, phosphate dikinase [Actinomyces sp. ICM54]MCQ5271999.1 pyruvate, phosphate dikinase [Schaalia odontolytica]MCQ5281816.1 pyruvate, phosphate dikinase [Schaalia odontolytica]